MHVSKAGKLYADGASNEHCVGDAMPKQPGRIGRGVSQAGADITDGHRVAPTISFRLLVGAGPKRIKICRKWLFPLLAHFRECLVKSLEHLLDAVYKKRWRMLTIKS